MQKLSQILLILHHGEAPVYRAVLKALSDVGRKTANVFLNEPFGQPIIAVDTNIFRFSNSTRMAGGKTHDKAEAELVRRLPDKRKRAYH